MTLGAGRANWVSWEEMSLDWTTGEDPGVDVPHGETGLPTWMCASTRCSVCPRNAHSLVAISCCSGAAHLGPTPSQWYQTSSIPFTSQDGQVRTLATPGTAEERKDSVKSGISEADAGAKGHLVPNHSSEIIFMGYIPVAQTLLWHLPAFRLLKKDNSS